MSSRPLDQSQVAELLGVTVRRIQQIDKDADVPPVRDAAGKYPCREYGQWLKNKVLTDSGVKDGERYDLNLERARLAKWQADRTELEVAILDGRLVHIDEIERVWTEMLGAFRARCLSIPGKAATLAYAAGSVEEAEEVLRDLVYEALTELAEFEKHQYETGKPGAGGQAAAGADGKPVGRRASKAKQRGKRGTGSVVH